MKALLAGMRAQVDASSAAVSSSRSERLAAAAVAGEVVDIREMADAD